MSVLNFSLATNGFYHAAIPGEIQSFTDAHGLLRELHLYQRMRQWFIRFRLLILSISASHFEG
jgi:hypothetical protein